MKAVIGAVCLNALLHETKHSHKLPDDLPRRFFQVLYHKTVSLWSVIQVRFLKGSQSVDVQG